MTMPKLRAPIILVHGLFGFDRLRLGGWTLASYFANIPEVLTAAGNRVLVAALSPTGGVAERATQLKAFVEQGFPGEPVHLVAHSMGGLDSRYMISCLDMAERVLSLTTLGTPHRGTAFADWGIRRLERIARPFLEMLSLPHQAFYDLTRASCETFNEQVPDASSVRYFSVAGQYQEHWLSPHWQVSYPIIQRAEGPNDGLVSVASAMYGESCEVWEGDHLSLINWLNPIGQNSGSASDRLLHYAGLIQRLADEGF
jgi:triacylglycerol lipase